MLLPRILVLKAGAAEPEVAQRHGDYESWFQSSLDEGDQRCDVVEAWRGETLPRAERYGGLLITGSLLSVRDEAPWMDGLARWALSAAECGTPVLGVCFGHQLLGEALGGRVERSPAGGEHGTVRVSLTEDGQRDPLFDGLGPELDVQAAHDDALVRPPSDTGVRLLAGNAHTPWQAFAAGPNLRAVQFHPEVSDAALVDMLRVNGHTGDVRPSAVGRQILQNWDLQWVRRRAR